MGSNEDIVLITAASSSSSSSSSSHFSGSGRLDSAPTHASSSWIASSLLPQQSPAFYYNTNYKQVAKNWAPPVLIIDIPGRISFKS
ncbi:hypothetical protein F8388_022279 [Cannabis sativa]|uniref:Uncharacterized protein n=1 Tax=Cannabis sativa TaxID=3483 RepID=A0A7J6E7Z7_CANSA|nr:hypothetical protein F8388_022279 [Cannabis sativa]